MFLIIQTTLLIVKYAKNLFLLYNHKNHSESIHTYILQMKYEIIDIMTIDETVKKDCALIK